MVTAPHKPAFAGLRFAVCAAGDARRGHCPYERRRSIAGRFFRAFAPPALSATPVWGWAQPGEKISVELGSATAETAADTKGQWKTTLDLRAANAAPQNLLIEGENEITVPDVLVGDVWRSSGQSNMQFTLNATTGGMEEVAHSANPSLRWFATETKPEFLEPQEDVPGRWVVAGPDTSGDCSGVAYYFAKKLQADLKIPIG